MSAAADPELQEVAVDRERLAGELAGGGVTRDHILPWGGGMRVDDPLALPADLALVRKDLRAFERTRAEGSALHGPAVVALLVPILEHSVRAWGGRRLRE